MASITDTLMALGSPDPSVRMPAEQAVTQAKDTNLADFIMTVLQEFRDESKPPFARNMAGTLLKNSVAPSFREVAARHALEERWKALPAPVRKQVKDEVLMTLGSPSREVRNVTANIIGSLSRIELPANEWPDLINVLVSAARSADDRSQEAALTTIGYVCEEGRDHDEVEEVLKPSTTDILSVIVNGMGSASNDIKLAATNALCNAMEYIHGNMQLQEQRDFLVDALCTTARECQVVKVRERAMESLVKVAELYYTTLPAYIQRLFEITQFSIFQDDEAVGLQAVQFWISICETERDLIEEGDVEANLNYASNGSTVLIDICLKLLVRQEDGQTDDDWNLSIAGGKLLQCLVETIGRNAQAPLLDFVYANINNQSWRQKEAALMVLGCLVGGGDEEMQLALQDTVAQAVPGLLQYMRDSNEMVSDTCAWVTALVCENYVDVFLKRSESLQQLFNIIGPMIGNVSDGRMGIRACHIVHNLALAFEEEENQPVNELSQYYSDLVQVLLRAIDGGDTPELKSQAQETLNALIDAAADDCVANYLTALVPELHQRMTHQLSLFTQGQATEETETMLALLCGSLSALARKLKLRFSPFADSSMTLLNNRLTIQPDTVQEEALTAIGSIAYAVKDQMRPYLAALVEYISRCLQRFDEPDSLFTVIGTIGDLCLSCNHLLEPYVDGIMNTLYQCLLNTEIDRDLKCAILTCFGDVILNVLGGSKFVPFMSTLLPYVDEMFRASCTIDIRGDPDSEEYVMSLWESTASLYSNTVQGFRDADVAALIPYLSSMLNFALHAANNSADYSETTVAAISVMGDMASVLYNASPQLRQQAKQALVTQAVATCVEQAVTRTSGEDRKTIQWTQTQLRKLSTS